MGFRSRGRRRGRAGLGLGDSVFWPRNTGRHARLLVVVEIKELNMNTVVVALCVYDLA